MKIMIEFNLPYPFCEKCTQLQPEKEAFYADAKPIVICGCAYARKCINAVRLMKEENDAADRR